MRFLFLLLLLAGTFCAQARNSLAALPRIQLYGRDYVRMTDWAQEQRVSLHWITRDRELRATNATSKLYFTMDSRFATFNGIKFVLSCPIIFQKEKVYVSVVDLQATLHPILYPEKMQTGTFVKSICLDAGHGGKDPGKLDGKNHEKRFTLLLAEEVERGLKDAGFKVVQTRTRDSWLDLPDRAKIANKDAADLFVSLHYNAAGNVNARGTEVYCLTPAGTTSSNADRGHSAASIRDALVAAEFVGAINKTLGCIEFRRLGIVPEVSDEFELFFGHKCGQKLVAEAKRDNDFLRSP